MIFFHFVEPDHWWYTKGPDYLKLIRLKNDNEKVLKNNEIKKEKIYIEQNKDSDVNE
jgi:hypothetical protein